MSLDPTDNRIVSYLDGELTDVEREAFETAMESSDELRAAVEYERRFAEFARMKLSVPADQEAKNRLLGALRRAGIEAADEAAPTPARIFKFPRVLGVPVAAAAAVFLLWVGGVFDGSSDRDATTIETNSARSGIFASVMAVNTDFDSRVDSLTGDNRSDRLRRVLATETDHRVWSDSPQSERLVELERLITTCIPHDMPIPRIPVDYELVGYREAALPLSSYPFRVPHVIFASGDKELSIYVLCGSQADAVERELAISNNEHLKGMSGCSRGGWLARRYGKVLLIFVSKLKFGLMCDFARQF